MKKYIKPTVFVEEFCPEVLIAASMGFGSDVDNKIGNAPGMRNPFALPGFGGTGFGNPFDE